MGPLSARFFQIFALILIALSGVGARAQDVRAGCSVIQPLITYADLWWGTQSEIKLNEITYAPPHSRARFLLNRAAFEAGAMGYLLLPVCLDQAEAIRRNVEALEMDTIVEESFRPDSTDPRAKFSSHTAEKRRMELVMRIQKLNPLLIPIERLVQTTIVKDGARKKWGMLDQAAFERLRSQAQKLKERRLRDQRKLDNR